MPQIDKEEQWHSMFERATPDEKALLNATRNADAIIGELRLIRWLLVVLTVIAFSAFSHWWPEWWHTPWWPN